ncbi:biliverdin-producing heme oxygenase [Aurantiacibacter spongiae]|uniref:Heme oxygenase n=1 Tax=Aurantiacibacter spongiae TaxID=2488860 RepID=A0A3N5DHE2_9SPHN|nr:biliverdin-producing heme oxygenase [Aurantiacibacter spongiae]RPF71082.1 hypothetical protein EG799_05240 [Aurantiacibacter spongiae]
MADNGNQVHLRTFLRGETAALHDALDSRTVPASLRDRDEYVRFLERQFVARRPIEAWAARTMASHSAPPAACPLIANDLALLGRSTPKFDEGFTLPDGADPIGLAWALAGSHLGNRAMLKSLADAQSDLPVSFFGDQAMMAFWKSLRPAIERDVSRALGKAAVLGARAVFARFLRAFAVDGASSRLAA